MPCPVLLQALKKVGFCGIVDVENDSRVQKSYRRSRLTMHQGMLQLTAASPDAYYPYSNIPHAGIPSALPA